MIKVAINGFGRIGRALARLIFEEDRFKLTLVNDIYSTDMMKHLFKHDSIYKSTKYTLNNVLLTNNKNLHDLRLEGVDILFECSGVYKSKNDLSKHLTNGAKKVILSAHSDEVKNFIFGVNETEYKHDKITAASSCTANCIVPVLKALESLFSIESLNATTIHSYTSDQNLLDNKSDDIRKYRASAVNIIPIDSNVKNTVAYFFPYLKGKIYSKSVRAPIENGVLIDLHIKLSKHTTIQEIKNALLHIKNQAIKVSFDDIVSKDIKADPRTSIVDMDLTQLSEGKLLRLILWQDNEYAYAKRVLDFAKIVGKDL